MSCKKTHFEKKLFAIAMFFLVIGGISIGLNVFLKKDILRSVLGKNAFLLNVLFLTIGISALSIGFHRDTYLPFLGVTALPCSLVKEHTPDHADVEVNLHGLHPGSKILYWATEPATQGLSKIKAWQQAYLDFANAGVAIVDAGGHASLRLRKPQPYTVPIKGLLESHVHWRVCAENGLLGPVNTTMI
jgi:hypothetical protein